MSENSWEIEARIVRIFTLSLFALRPPRKAEAVEMQEHFLPSWSKGSF
jgi:hypothetical protein